MSTISAVLWPTLVSYMFRSSAGECTPADDE
jgi:hypothetical protein